jgi:hypothetical protein
VAGERGGGSPEHSTPPGRSIATPAGKILVNEINTMPGMTPASGFPMMWAATGLPLPQLVDRIIQTALCKRPLRP